MPTAHIFSILLMCYIVINIVYVILVAENVWQMFQEMCG